MGRAWTWLLLATLVAAMASESSAWAARRVALVVGNSAYQSVPALPNTRNDADAMAQALRNSGFEVIAANDLDYLGFDDALQKFVRSLANAEVSLFYYSGHGVQIGGDNRIIPVDARFRTSADMEVETLTVRTILTYMQKGSKAQVVILDSCRNNPFPARAYYIGNSLEEVPKSGGLAAESGGSGSLIAYSTQPGNVAVDGLGKLSPFTDALLRNAFQPGVDLETALKKVTKDVWEATGQRQRPWTSQTLIEPLYLNSPPLFAAASDVPAASGEAAQTGTSESNIIGILRDSLAAVQRIPIGIGAVAMTAPLPVLRSNDAVDIELAELPGRGVFLLKGKPLRTGTRLPLGSWNEIAYQPSVGTENTEVQVEWRIRLASAGEAIPMTGTIKPFVLDCDIEAGEPLDLQGVTAGKLPNEIDPDRAIAACEDAMRSYPEAGRFVYQMGRAKLAKRQTSEAIQLFKQALDMGHVRSAYQLGYLAQRGLGRKQDLAEANGYFRYSAEYGDPYGMLAYGKNLVFGRGIAADEAAGVPYLNRAVEMGHTYAMNELGSMYYSGRAVAKNPARGVRFFEAALARGDIYAMNNLGYAYLDGNGVEADPVTAMALFKKASDGGHPAAPNNVGRMFASGRGVKKDLDQAVTWYKLGAERGDTWAASNLATIYLNGPKPYRDQVSAALYYGLAVSADAYDANKDARAALRSLPEKSKMAAVKQLVGELGPADGELPNDLDGALVELSRLVMQKRNPRLDLF